MSDTSDLEIIPRKNFNVVVGQTFPELAVAHFKRMIMIFNGVFRLSFFKIVTNYYYCEILEQVAILGRSYRLACFNL